MRNALLISILLVVGFHSMAYAEGSHAHGQRSCHASPEPESTPTPRVERPLEERGGFTLSLEPCLFETFDGRKTEAELGRLTVPENRHNPRSRLTELAFVRFKSTAKQPIPPVVYLAGGPGASGIAAARGRRFDLFMAMRELGDVIALDQRATGMSKPGLECRGKLGYPLDKPGDREDLLRRYREQSSKCREELIRQGVDLAGYTIIESADDVESLRQALAVERISLWSISYGTQLALATIRRHERGIHRAILAGVEGPDVTFKLPSAIQAHLATVARLAEQDAQISRHVPDLLQLMRGVHERLESEPLIVEIDDSQTKQKANVTLGKFDLQWMTAAMFVGGEAVFSLPALHYAVWKRDASTPDVRRWAQWIAGVRRGSVGSPMQIMIDCASGGSPERLARIRREEISTLVGRLTDYPLPDICDAWGKPDLGSRFRTPVRSRVPVLLISGTLDGRTPVSNGEVVQKGFPNSAHLVIEGATHSDPLFLSSPKIKEAMVKFMRGLPVSTAKITLPPPSFSPVATR